MGSGCKEPCLIRWEKGYAEKLVVVTDLDEKEAQCGLVPDAVLD